MATVGKLSADSMAAIGRELRLKYKEIIAEGMPERFAKILRRLDEPSNEAPGNGSRSPVVVPAVFRKPHWVWALELDHKRDRRWHVLRLRWQCRHKP